MRCLLIGGGVWLAASVVMTAVVSLLWRKDILRPSVRGPRRE